MYFSKKIVKNLCLFFGLVIATREISADDKTDFLLLCGQNLYTNNTTERLTQRIATHFKSRATQGKEEREKLVKEMHQYGITSYDCIKELSKIKNQKVLATVKEAFSLTNQQIAEYKQKIREQKMVRNARGKGEVTFADASIPLDIQHRITEKIHQEHIQESVKIQTGRETLVTIKNDKEFILCLNLHDFSFSQLSKGELSQPCWNGKDEALLAHELKHIQKKHTNKRLVLLSMISKEESFNVEQFELVLKKIVKTEKQAAALYKYMRTNEREADFLAACQSYKNAQNHFLLMQGWYQDELETLKILKKYKLDDSVMKDLVKPSLTHPPLKKRFLWATIIKDVKEEEDRLYNSLSANNK